MTIDLATLVAASWAAIEDIFARHELVFLSFSGGKDSLVLSHLREPYHDRLTLIWTNTGHMAPPMVEFVRSFGGRFNFIEVAPERPMLDHWREHGIPAVVLPLDHLEGIDWRSPRLQPWLNCCAANRNAPVNRFMEEVTLPCAFLNGQRKTDQAATGDGLSSLLPAYVEVALPIFEWTDADVFAFVAEQGIVMHPDFAVSSSSSECINCPAIGSREKMRLFDQHYPEEPAFVRQAGRYALGLAATRAMELDAILADPSPAERNVA